MAIEIDADDVSDAESFLETLLTEEIPSGRFTEGSALRDLVIKSMAFIFAHLRKESNTTKALQSLLTVRNIATVDPDVDRAVANATDAILSNWFVNRKAGDFARGLVFIEVSRRQDYVIPGNHRFNFDRTHSFYLDIPDSTQNTVIDSDDLIPVISADGVIQSYQFSVRVIAAKTGTDFNVAPGNWLSGSGFSPFANRVFSSVRFTGGKGRETTTELIERSNTAISVRNLINERSIEAVLREQFSSLNRLIVVGFGDNEMYRDRKLEFATNIQLHVGGHFDIYLELPRVQATFEGRLGDAFTRPDNLINIFRDETNVTDWTATNVQLGDVIRVASGLDEAPKDFVIKVITETELQVSTNTPFSAATDEDGTFIGYYIYRPLFTADTQILPAIGTYATGQTSRQSAVDNRILLPGGPVYDILDVAITDPDAGDPYIDPSDGYVHFPVRSNETPNAVVSQQYLEYQLVNENPTYGQSQLAVNELYLESSFNGKNVRVTYDTLAGLDTIHSYVTDRFNRVLSGNVLAKGFHQVYLSMTVPYRLKKTATTTVDEDALRDAIVSYINDFDPNDVIDVSDISFVTRSFSDQIGAVLPFTIDYVLIVPDGRTIKYTTSDQVTLISANISDTGDNVALDNPEALSVSDKTVRYITTLDRILVDDQT